jgi:hypothetical protein
VNEQPSRSGHSGPARSASAQAVLVSDTYGVDIPGGSVLGTSATSGQTRGGADVEGRMAVDNGALRLRPLSAPGWGRQGVSYGPVGRQAGLVATVHVLNGHHCSQTFYMPETTRQRVRRWLGRLRRGRWPVRPRHHESLAVGLFAVAAPNNPIADGHALVVHAVTKHNGELWASVRGRPLRVLTGLQNLPLAAAVVLREQGAVYYAATVPNDPDLPALPMMRPLAVDPGRADQTLHAGVHQRILGEVGYRVDTRVYRTDVGICPEFADWCTTAVVADRLLGVGVLGEQPAERGGSWRVTGRLSRTPHGATGEGSAVLEAPEPVGLLHALVLVPREGEAELVLRANPLVATRWRLRLSFSGATLVIETEDGPEVVARSADKRWRRGQERSIQVLDDGCTMSVHVDGDMVFGDWHSDERLAGASWVGFAVGGGARIREFEAHPRTVRAPLVQEPAWSPSPLGSEARWEERFDGAPGCLDGAVTPSGGRRWERVEGEGTFELLEGGGVRVRATPDRPNPGRTIYAAPWDWPSDVDVRATLVPPGSVRGERHNCRSGLVLWQDADNYLVVNVWLDDWLESASLSTFYRVRGHEDMYDAVWTLTGDRVTWGVPFELRVAFDGERFTAYLDRRPTLYRAIRDVYPDAPPLKVRRVGIVANEEWGDDTGTMFTSLIASTRASGGLDPAPRREDAR